MNNSEGDPSDGLIYSLNLDIDAVRALYDHLEYSIMMWPGAPRRPIEEQVFLSELKSAMFTILLEHSFMNDEADKD